MLIRPAEVKDSDFAVEMIYATMGNLADQWFGLGNHDRALKTLSWFFCHFENQFSYRYSEILEIDGQPAAFLLALTGKELKRLISPMFTQIIKYFGILDTLRFLWRTLPMVFEKEAEEDEYYISNLAVHPDFRRRGLGETLLIHAEKKARGLDLSKCSLLVEIGNARAKALYQKMGYQVVSVSTNAMMRKLLDTPGEERMVKTLSPE
ncbi:MAG: GNAT family N-acetyltransferase [Anaerolineaceae bacterium]